MIRRILAIIFGIIIGAVAVCGIWYTVAPREFLQTVLSDEAYAGFTLTNNAARTTRVLAKNARAKSAYNYKADIGFEVDKSAVLGSQDIANAVSDYLDGMVLDGKICFQKDGFKATMILYGADESLLSGQAIIKGTRQYFKVDQLGDKWFERSHKAVSIKDGKINVIEEIGSLKKLKDADLSADTKITVTDEEKVLTLGDISVSGEVVTLKTSAEDLKKMLSSQGGGIEAYLDEHNIKELDIVLYVDSKNHVVGFSAEFVNENNEKATNIVGVKDLSGENKYAAEYGTDKFRAEAVLDFESAPYEEYTIPSSKEVVPIDSETMKKELETVYNAILNKIIGDKVNSFFGSLFGGAFGG